MKHPAGCNYAVDWLTQLCLPFMGSYWVVFIVSCIPSQPLNPSSPNFVHTHKHSYRQLPVQHAYIASFYILNTSFFYLIFSTSYSYAGLSLRYSLRLGSSHSPGQQMRRKLMAILRLKCHAIFLDLKVRRKIFQGSFFNISS